MSNASCGIRYTMNQLTKLAKHATPEELLYINEKKAELMKKLTPLVLNKQVSEVNSNPSQQGVSMYRENNPSEEYAQAEDIMNEEKLGEAPEAISVRRQYYTGDNKREDVQLVTMVQPDMDGGYEIDYVTPGGKKKNIHVDSNGYGKNGAKSQWNIEDLKRFRMSDPSQDGTGWVHDTTFDTILNSEYINDPEKLNKVMDKLIELDSTGENESHEKYLREFVSNMTSMLSKVIPNMPVMIDNNPSQVQNKGAIRVDSEPGIYLSLTQERPVINGTKSAAETYAHELGHGAIGYALASDTHGIKHIKTELIKLRRKAMKYITPEMLMSDVNINYEAEYRQSEALWHYLNGSEHSLEEFVVHSVTNEKVMKALSEIDIKRDKVDTKGMSIYDTIVEYLHRLISLVLDKAYSIKPGMKGDALAMKLFNELSAANNVAMKKLNENRIGKITTAIDNIQDRFIKWQHKGENAAKRAALTERPSPTAPKWKQMKWIAANWYQLTTNPALTGELTQIMHMFGMKEEGTIQTLMRHFRDIDQYSEKWQKMMLASLQVDKHREDQALTISALITEQFSKKLKNSDKKALYGTIVKGDIGALSEQIGIDEVENILSDDVARRNMAIEIQQKIKDISSNERKANYYIAQAHGLGKYMLTGKSKKAQHINAEAISKMHGTKYQSRGGETQKQIEILVDQLATLEYIKYTDPSVNQRTAELIKSDGEAVENTIKSTRAGAKRRYEAVGIARYKKGYSRDTLDDFKTVQIASIKDKSRMERNGYTLREKLGKDSWDTSTGEMAIYVNGLHHLQNLNRSTVRFTDDKDGGIGIYEILLKSGDNNIQNKIKQAKAKASMDINSDVESMMNGNAIGILESDNLSRAVYDEYGSLVDMRYEIGTEFKETNLSLKQSIGESVGRIWSHETDMEESRKINQIAFEEMKLDMEENYTGYKAGRNGHNYIKVSKYSNDESVRKIYNALPTDIKKQIDKMEETDEGGNIIYKKGLHVRQDMLLDIFGVRDLSIIDAKGVNMMPRVIKTMIKLAEEIWKEIVAISKVDIIIRTPGVLLNNIISNLMYSVQLGHSPIAIAKLQLDGLKAINEYTKANAEVVKLQAKIDSGIATNAEMKEMMRLKSDMKENAAHELIEEGLYQPIAEDANLEDMKSSSRIVNAMGEKFEGAPEILKFAGNWMFLTEKTWVFKAMMHGTQKSDFVARYAQYYLEQERAQRRFYTKNNRKMNTKELNEMKARLMVNIREAFINYTKPDSALVQYANDMGLAMFTKYAWRIQKVIKDGVTERPVRFLMALLGQELMDETIGYDPDDIAEKSIIVKGPTHLFYMPPIMDTVERTIVPHILRY